MKAAYFEKYGTAADVMKIGDLPKPEIKDPKHDMIVKVAFAGVNPADWKIRTGLLKKFVKMDFPCVLGLDFSGVVESVGSQMTDFKVGDVVYGRIDALTEKKRGCDAEYVKVNTKIDCVALKPDNISHEEAAGAGVVALTAYVGLVPIAKLNTDPEKNKNNMKVLVIGASGGVGMMAVQVAKALCCHVTGICSAKNEEFVKSLGADEVVDYTSGELSELLKGKEFEIIYDAIGGDEYWELAQTILKPKGHFVTAAGKIAHIKHPLGITDVLSMVGSVVWRSISNSRKYSLVLSLPVQYWKPVDEMIRNGQIKLITKNVFPLEQIKDAHESSETGRAVGKIVLKISS